jgi:hypothetical protein
VSPRKTGGSSTEHAGPRSVTGRGSAIACKGCAPVMACARDCTGMWRPRSSGCAKGDGAPLPAALRARLQREGQQVQLLTAQIGCLEAERRTKGQSSTAPVVERRCAS